MLRMILLASIGLGMMAVRAEDTPTPLPDLSTFKTEVEKLVKAQYPNAKFEMTEHGFDFEFNTRKFWIHHALKTGEWQDASEQKGPQKGGIMGTFELLRGKWTGAAVVPQTFDYRYFKALLMAPESAQHNCHLVTHLNFPADAKPEFLRDFQTLVNDFQKHLK
jgi:hypothetical protein